MCLSRVPCLPVDCCFSDENPIKKRVGQVQSGHHLNEM
jgi:hypothetical protein